MSCHCRRWMKFDGGVSVDSGEGNMVVVGERTVIFVDEGRSWIVVVKYGILIVVCIR